MRLVLITPDFVLSFSLAPRKASTASNGAITPTATANKIARTAKSDGVKVTGTGDGTRDKCAELLYDGLACDSGAPTELILQRAKAVEVAVLNNIGSTSAAYKSKIRSLFVNLKDKGNPSLREDVVSGDISAERLAKMSPGVRIFRSCFVYAVVLNILVLRTWLQRSGRRPMTRLSRTIYSHLSVQKNNKQKQMLSSAGAASKGNVAIVRLKPDLLMSL